MTESREPFEIPMPFDGHLHLRQNDVDLVPGQRGMERPVRHMNLMDLVLPYTAAQFWGGVAMTNTRPPATTAALVRAYEEDIRVSARRSKMEFHPIAPLFLTRDTRPELLLEPGIVAAKFMPEGGTTNAMSGLPGLKPLYPCLEAMQQKGIRFCVHGEVTDAHLKSRQLEPTFIDRELIPALEAFPKLIVVFEHATTKVAVDFAREFGKKHRIHLSITPQHLNEDYDSLTRKNGKNGLWREKYCLPVYKTDEDRRALLECALHSPMAYAGTDSAPHLDRDKASRGCCAGAFTAPTAMQMYATAFESSGVSYWEKSLEQFASTRGPAAFDLKPSNRTLRLVPEAHQVPATIEVPVVSGASEMLCPEDTQAIVPYMAGETLSWNAYVID